MDPQFKMLYLNALVSHEANLYMLYFKTINYQMRIEKLGINKTHIRNYFQEICELLNMENDKTRENLKLHVTTVQKDFSVIRNISTLKHQRISALSLGQIIRKLAEGLYQINEGVHKVDVYRTLLDIADEQDDSFMDPLQGKVDAVIWEFQRVAWRQKKSWVQMERQCLIQV